MTTGSDLDVHRPSNEAPVVVSFTPPPAERLDLVAFVVPVWRWRLAAMLVLLLGVIAALWTGLQQPDRTWRIVVDAGDLTPSVITERLTQVVIPAALAEAPAGYRPDIDVRSAEDASASPVKNDAAAHSRLIAVTFETAPAQSHEAQQLQAAMAASLETWFQMIEPSLGATAMAVNRASLNELLAQAKVKLDIVTDPTVIAARKADLEAVATQAQHALDTARSSAQYLEQRRATLNDRVATLTRTIDQLLTTSDGDTQGTIDRITADRITALRLELEDRIPAERQRIEAELAQDAADERRASLDLTHAQSAISAFDKTIQNERGVAQTAVTLAQANLDQFEARAAGRLVHVAPSLLSTTSVEADRISRGLMALIVLIIAAAAAVGCTWCLEGLYQARRRIAKGA